MQVHHRYPHHRRFPFGFLFFGLLLLVFFGWKLFFLVPLAFFALMAVGIASKCAGKDWSREGWDWNRDWDEKPKRKRKNDEDDFDENYTVSL